MKNLTEFSGLVLRRAAEVRSKKLSELKAQLESAPALAAEPAAAEEAAQQDMPTEVAGDEAETTAPAIEEASAEAEAEAAVEAAAEAAAEEPSAEAEPGVAAGPAAGETGEADKGPRVDDDVLNAAIAEEMGLSEERAKYLMGALKAVGRKNLAQVRNVRVFQGEAGPPGSFSIDDLHFVVDKVVVPAPARRDDRKGGKGRDDRKGGKGGKPGGPGGPGGGFGGGVPKGGRATGGFDGAVRDERPGDVPAGGLGWSLSRAPGDAKKEGRGKPARKGPPRRGKPGGNRPEGARPAGARPGGGDKPGDSQKRGRGGRGGRPQPSPQVTVKPTVVSTPLAAAKEPKEQAPASAPTPAVESTETK